MTVSTGVDLQNIQHASVQLKATICKRPESDFVWKKMSFIIHIPVIYGIKVEWDKWDPFFCQLKKLWNEMLLKKYIATTPICEIWLVPWIYFTISNPLQQSSFKPAAVNGWRNWQKSWKLNSSIHKRTFKNLQWELFSLYLTFLWCCFNLVVTNMAHYVIACLPWSPHLSYPEGGYCK